MKGVVYLICNPDADAFKIGVTKRNVNERLKEIQTSNSCEVFVVNTYETEIPYKLESVLHKYFKMKRTSNEWFNLTPEDVSSFYSLCEKYENIFKSIENNDFLELSTLYL